MEEQLLRGFRCRPDSFRERMLRCLALNLDNQVSVSELMDTVYGKKMGSRTALMQVVGAVRKIIERYRLPFIVLEQNDGKEKTVGLYSKKPKAVTK